MQKKTCHLLWAKYCWLHIFHDIHHVVTSCTSWLNLPQSSGNTTILAVVGRFSKSPCLIPLPSLPSAFTTANFYLVKWSFFTLGSMRTESVIVVHGLRPGYLGHPMAKLNEPSKRSAASCISYAFPSQEMGHSYCPGPQTTYITLPCSSWYSTAFSAISSLFSLNNLNGSANRCGKPPTRGSNRSLKLTKHKLTDARDLLLSASWVTGCCW